jgi:hypothetical protein
MKKANKGIVSIHGRQYKTVVMRVNEFRTTSAFAGFGIETKILEYGFTTGFVVVQASITDAKGRVVGSGLAEEKRGAGNINKFSALENCETSAIGRALASIGLGGEEYCSADELVLAIDKQNSKNEKPKVIDIKTAKQNEKTFDKEEFRKLLELFGEVKDQQGVDAMEVILDHLGLPFQGVLENRNAIAKLSENQKLELMSWLETQLR